MNRIYKVIWSKVKNCYIVVSEIAKSHSKPISTKLNSGKTVAAVLAVAALCAGMTTSVMAADKYYSVDDYEGRLASMGNADNSGAQGIGSMAAGIGASVQSKSMFQGAMATVVGALNTVATESTAKAYDGVANSIVGVANATQNANATLIFGAGNAVSNSYGDVTLDTGSINPADPVGTARKLGEAVGDSGGQMLVIGGANSADYARFSAITGVSNKLTGADGNTSDYNFITGAKNTLTNADSTYVIGSSNTVSDGTSNVVIGDNRKLTSTTGDVVIGSADEEMETTVSDATILGHNANATTADGVALGSKSVASVAKGVAGTVPTGTTVSDTDKASATWTSTLGAVSVGVPGTNAAATQTRQITGVAAGTQATDAVNVAQLSAVNTVVDSNTTKISNLTTTVNANKIRFFSATGNDSDQNVNNTGAEGWKSIAVGSSTLNRGHWAASVGMGGINTAFSGNNFGTGNQIFNYRMDTIPVSVINPSSGSIQYTYKRDENGKFIDTVMWGGFATTLGTFNMITPDYIAGVLPLDGFSNTVIGSRNTTNNSNGAYILGWNNKVTNSYFVDDEKLPTEFNGVYNMNSESFGGSIVAIGMDNTVDGAQHSYIMGTANTVQGNVTSKGVVEEAATDNVVIGDNHKVDNASHTVILGSADTETTTDQDGVVVVGHNANATVADGVALGPKSVASVAAGVAGTVPTGTTVSDTDKASATWTSTLGAVSVGDTANNLTRQIAGVAAGTQDTDAVNVAQLNAVNTVVNNLTTTVDSNKIHFFQVNQGTSGTNYNNDGATGTNSIAIGKASTVANQSIIIGQGAISNSGSSATKGSGDIAIGMQVQVNNYANQGGGIAIGYNARSENMAGQQERYLALGQSEYTTGIAIGRNSFARSGSTMVGTHNYSGAIGDVTLSSNPASSMLQPNLNPFATTIGANSFNSGTMSTVMGVYSIASSNYTGNNDSGKAPKNFGATIMGSLNSIESATADSNRAGVANSIVGLANRANNANGALIFGAGNEITNSVTPIVVPMDASIASAKDLQTNLISSIRASNSAGSTMAMGGGNKADYTQLTSIMGVNNTVTGTSDDISMYNYISGFNNTATNTDNVTVTGTNRNVTGANNTILIGSADSTIETTASDAVAVGRNSNVTVDGGVALGANSVARIENGVVGYDQSSKITDASSITYDSEKYQSLQTQLTDTKTSISTLNTDITKLEAAIASYEKWYPDYEQDATWQQMQAQYKAKQDELATAKTNLDTIENEIGDTLKPLSTWQATAAAVSVGDVSKGITRQITDVAAGTEDTDAVNVAQLKAAKVEVVGSGDNVTVTSDNSEGYTKYTVAATDTKVTGLALDKNTLTLSQNGQDDLKVEGIATTTDLANNKTHYFHVNSAANGTNYDNDGAKGANSIAIGKASTAGNDSIIIGQGAISKSGNTTSYPIRSGDIAIGMGVQVNNYVNQGGGIAIGYNARSENMAGQQERLLSLGQSEYTTGIAIGRNTYARSGSTMLGTHNYSGAIGDVTVNTTPAGMSQPNLSPFATTVGANSFSAGAMSTVTGVYSIATSDYQGKGFSISDPLGYLADVAKAPKNFGATIMGSLNSIESATAANNAAGVGNSIVGLANVANNANGALIFGAGNEISNSITDIDVPQSASITSAKELQTKLMSSIKSSNSGGSTLVMGGGNKADYTQQSALIGVNNTLEGTESSIAQYNALTGFNNTATGVTNVTVTGTNNTVSDSTSIVNLGNENAVSESNNTILLGDNRTVTGSDNSIILGRANKETTTTLRAAADTTLTTEADNVVVMGYNANVTVDDGVALGSNSVASVDKGVDGYNPSTKVLTGSTWTSTVGSVSVGDAANDITRQITGVAAGTADTDAVNVAQLKANKVTLEEGENVTITSTVADDGATTYTIKSTDTNTTLASGTVSYVGADGTLVLIDSAGDKVTVTGLKNTYVESAALDTDTHTLTLNRNEGAPITVTGIATTADIAANKVKYFSVNSELAANQNNDGAKGTNSLAIGPNAVAQHENGVALGTNVYSGGKGSIVIGSDAKVSENIALEGSIVIGKGAVAFTGGGEQEALLGMDPTNWPNRGSGGYDNPTDASRVATSIVIGTNAFGRTGSIDIGDRVYRGTMGGKQITDNNSSFHVNQTTLGTNTYNKGLFSTMVGSYSIATGGFTGDGGRNTLAYGAQNFGATVMGSLNSIRSNGSASFLSPSYQGIANTIVGLGNITDNSNGSLVFGAGNKITNSITSISMPTSGADSVDAMVDKLQDTIKKSNSGGATLAIGGGNTADYTRTSSIIGVNNTLTGTSSNISQYNALTGYNNTATNVDNVTVTGINNKVTDTTTAVVIGDNRTLTGVSNNVVIGSADAALETTVSDAVAIGRNANVTIDGGVALGANSVARTDKGVVGYDPSGRITDADSILGSNTQYQSLQTEVNDVQTTVSDLTAKAAEYQANIDMIVSMYPDNSYEQDAGYQGIKAALESTQAQLATAQADLDSKQSALAEAGKALYTWQSTAGSVSVGDVSKGITRQITDVAAGTADTDAVNVAQLKANKVSLVQGANVTITSAAADDGGTTYTIASTDTYTESGTYDADSKKIKFTQNDTTKNYEVDLSGLTDNIDKGLSFAGDSGDAINKQLGETINIVGGATDVTTGNNIGVVSEDGKLNVRLAKDLTGLNSVAVGDVVTLDTTGLTITNGPSVTTTGINAGNQKITNVVAGVADTDAVNVSQLNANKIHYFHVNSAANGTNYNNNGATGTDAIAIGKSSTAANNSVAIGNATILDSNGGKGSGDIAIGNNAKINNYADQGSGIALGANTFVENMAGKQEAIFALGQTTFSGNFLSTARVPADPSKVAAGIAIGENSYARSGSLMVGTHNYRGTIGDVTVDTSNIKATGVNVNATTLGTNSFNNGAFSTIAGAYSIASGSYAGGRNSGDAAKNFGATIVGSLNSIESATAANSNSGIANSIVGFANKTANANGALIFGAGNEITNSVTSITVPGTSLFDGDSAADSAKELQNLMKEAIEDSNSGGSTLAIGGSNKADYTRASAIIGVKNTLTGTSSDISQYNYITGYNNTGTNVDNVTIIGTNRTVSDASNSVVIGSADSVMTSSASDAVTIGRNANTTVAGGVALGSSSIASVDKGVAGYDVTTGKASTETTATWKSTAAAVSVGDVANNVTRQITGVAAGMEDTDAVNVAQLKQVAAAAEDAGNTKLNFAGDDKTAISRGNGDTLNIIGGATATDADGNSLLTDNNIGVVKDGDTALKVQLAKNLTGLNSVAVGDKVTLGTTGLVIKDGPSVTTTGIDAGSKTITNVANGVNPTDAVNVSQLNANKVTVAAGTNVTVTPTTGADNSTTYTVNAIDTKVTGGTATYDKATGAGTITLTTTDAANPVKVTGLQDTYVTDVALKDHTLTITQNAGDPFVVNNIATMDDITSVSGKHTAITLNKVAPTAGKDGALGEYIGDSNLTMAVQEVDGQKVYDLKMSKDLVAGTKPGADGKNGEAGSITIIGEPGKDGTDGKNTRANITVKDGKNGLDGTDGITRIVYKDEDGTDHEIATMDDGLKFTGDTEGVTVAKKLNETLSITGGITDADQLTAVDNIGVVASDSGLKVRLSKDLQDLNSVRIGGTTTDGKGIYIANQTVTSTKDGVDPEKGNYITGLTNTTWNPTENGYVSGRAATEDQLQSAISQVTTEVGGKHTAITLDGTAPTDDGKYIGTGNLTMAVKDVDGQKVYDLKMSNNLVAGTPGADGKNGEAGSITVIGEPGSAGADGKNASANITVKDGTNGLDGKDGLTRITYEDEDGTPHEVATLDDGLKFTGDTEGVTVAKKLNETLSITGGITDADQLTTVDNIGVVASSSGLKVRLAKDLQDLNSVRIGGTTENGKGIYIANQSVNNTKGNAEEGNYVTGLDNKTWDPTNKGYVSGRAATEDQLNSVYETINSNIEANKVTSGKNITVSEDNKVSLNDNITLGGDTAANQVNINGNDAKITAGDGANKVVVDGSKGQVTIGDAANGGIVMGNQTDVVGTKSDGAKDSQNGQFITGLDNTTWDPANKGVVADRAATEGQLKDIADKISDIDTAVKSTSRVFESDSGADAQVTRKSTDPMKLKGGADANNLSDGNIGVVNNSDNTGFDIKLSKDIKGLNSIEVNNKITIGTGDNQTIIEGDKINTGSVTTGNTTINNDGLTIVNEDSSKNITINNNNVNMGGNEIKNVGEGTDPTSAINKTQFDRAINNLGTGMNQINNRVNKLDNRVNRVGAGAAALAALHPLEFSPDAKWEVTAGVGNYRGANAIALGAFYRPNFDTMFSIGTSYGGGENMINAGVTWRIGEGETKAYPSKTVMAQEIDELKTVVSEQQDQIEELKKLVNTLINK